MHQFFSFYLDCNDALENRYEDCNDNEIGRKIVWDNAKVVNFKSVLMNNNAYIRQLTSDVSTEPIDDVVKTFSQFLHDQAFDVFGKTYNFKRSVSPNKPDNKWFDATCHDAQRDFKTARNAFNRNRNENTRKNFTRVRTKYNSAKKTAHQSLTQEDQWPCLNKLCSTRVNKAFDCAKVDV